MDTRAWKKDRESLTESYEALFQEADVPVVDELAIDEPVVDEPAETIGGVQDMGMQEIPPEAMPLYNELVKPSWDIEQLAKERRLSDYVAHLNTLLKGADEAQSLNQPPEVD